MSAQTRFGIVLPSTLRPRTLVELGVAVEQAGWDGVFLWDTLLGSDVWVALAAIAVGTERVRLGPFVTALPRHRPWKLASETVSLNHLSLGRLILPVGLGGAEDEWWDKLGLVEEIDRQVRITLHDEGHDVLSSLCGDTPFTYHGERYNIREVPGRPPLQIPRIPNWVPGFGWPALPATEIRRIWKWDGVIIDGHVKVSKLREFVVKTLGETAAFDIVLEGISSGDDRAQARNTVQQAAEYGMTWWLETPPTGYDSASVRLRIERGPPD